MENLPRYSKNGQGEQFLRKASLPLRTEGFGSSELLGTHLATEFYFKNFIQREVHRVKREQNLTWCLESDNQLLAENTVHLPTNPGLLFLQQERSQIFYPGSAQGHWAYAEGGIPFVYSHQQPDPPSHRKGLSCFRCELRSSHHVMGWPLKHFKWVTDGSPDKWTGEGSPSFRPTLVLPPEAAAQTHTMVRGRTQLWQPKLQKEFWAML